MTALLIGAAALGLGGCGEARLDPAQARFVGRAACAECHALEDSLWQGSHHDLAMQEVADSTVLADFNDVDFIQFGVESRLYRRGPEYWVRTDGPDGQLQDYRVAYVFGVTPLQQYLIEFPGGRYQTLALTWDSRPEEGEGQRWYHIYPDEPIPHDDILHWTGPAQNWNYMCAECHSTDLRKNYDVETDSYQTTWEEIDVSCEACHGPGSAHVAWAEREAPSEGEPYPSEAARMAAPFTGRDEWAWIVAEGESTARREPPAPDRREIEACARCHSRRQVIWGEYTHGQPFLDTHQPRLLDEELYYADGQILEEVYVYGSFLQSKMYAAGVTCADCHESHSLELLGPGDAVCLRCHLAPAYDTREHHFHEPGTEGARCAECHAPATNYMVVDPRRDHSFRVPRPDLAGAVGAPDACTRCHADRGAAWSAEAIVRWYGPERALERTSTPHYGQILAGARLGFRGVDRAVAGLVADRKQPAIVRATAITLLRRYPTPTALGAIERALGDADPLVRVAALRALEIVEPARRVPAAFHLLDDPIRAVRLQAARTLAGVRDDELTTAQRVALNRAVDEYVQSQLANADRPTAHLNIGVIYALRGRIGEAEAAYRTALRIGPWFVPAYVNLADLYRETDRDDAGEVVLRQALELAPENATAHHALGLLLVRQGRSEEAVEELAVATELDPARAQFAYVYGVALDGAGRTDDAVVALAAALENHPYDRPMLYALASLHAKLERFGEAIRYARLLVEVWPDDAEALQLLTALEARRDAGRD